MDPQAQSCRPQNVAIARAFEDEFGRCISSRTVKAYADNQEYSGERSGRNVVIPLAVEDRIHKLFRSVRAIGAVVVRNTLASIARGIVRNYNKTAQQKILNFAASQSWITGFIERRGLHFRRATTNRTVTAEEIYTEGQKFYKDLQDYRLKNAVAVELVFNVDEFFVHNLVSGGKSTWSETAGAQTTVAVAESKTGFTGSVTSCADGTLPLIQFIYKGMTEQVNANLSSEKIIDGIETTLDDFIQCQRPETHFQDSDTWALYCAKLREIVARKKKNSPSLKDIVPILIVDCAGQHVETKVNLPGWQVFAIPAKMTHIFQPADQYIISNIRQKTRRGLSTNLEDRIAEGDLAEADNKELFGDGAAARRFKAKLTLDAFREVTPQLVLRSWHVTGIPKYLLKDTTELHNGYDEAYELVKGNRGGEFPQRKLDVLDSDAEIDVDEPTEVASCNEPDSKRLRFEVKMDDAASPGKRAMTATERQQKKRCKDQIAKLVETTEPSKRGAIELAFEKERAALSTLFDPEAFAAKLRAAAQVIEDEKRRAREARAAFISRFNMKKNE